MLYTIYIGSNNVTKELELSKIKEIVGTWFDGFTIYEVSGYWKGIEEKTAKVEIYSDGGFVGLGIFKLVNELKEKLNQDSIMLRKHTDTVEFI